MSDPRNLATSQVAGVAALLFAVALLARTAAFGRYVTPDEFAWLTWGMRLRAGVLAGDWGATIQTAQPGVTTTWLAALAIQLTTWLQPQAATAALAWAQPLAWLTPDDGTPYQRLALFLPAARWLIASVNALGCAAVYALARRRWGAWPALLGALALALDPFAAGLGGVLITDALLALACVLTLLLAVPHGAELPDRRTAALAGSATALAMLTKLPGVLLVALVPLIWLWHTVRSGGDWRAVAGRLALWLLALLSTLLLLLPAIWGAPAHLLSVLRNSGTLELSLGQDINLLGRVWGNPPPLLFYPLALVLRLAPLAMLGLLTLLCPAVRRRSGPLTIWGALFVVLFIAGLSVSTRVFDRYALPVSLLLTLLGSAAFDLWAAEQPPRRRAWALGSGMVLSLLFLLVSWPTPMLAYNWLLGGPPVARWALPVGWGEAHSAAARALAADSRFVGRVFTDNVPAVAPFVAGETFFLNELHATTLTPEDAVIVVVSNLARELERTLAAYPPAQTIRVGPQTALIYRGLAAEQLGLMRATPVALALQAGGVRLLEVGAVQSRTRDQLLVRSVWLGTGAPTAARVVLALTDASGYRWASQEWPLVSRAGQPATAWPPDEAVAVDWQLALPADIPPAAYNLTLSLFDAAGARIGWFSSREIFAGVQPTLLAVSLMQPQPQPPLAIPVPLTTGQFVGHAPLPAGAESGSRLTLDVWWERGAESSVTWDLALTNGDADHILIATSDVSGVPAGNRVRLRPTWTLPADLSSGPAAVALNGVPLGALDVAAVTRSFTLPDDVAPPLGVQVGAIGLLQAADVRQSDDALTLRLVWQAADSAPTDYTIFVHARAADGAIVAQQDRPPAVATSRWVTGQVIVDTFTFAADPAFDTFAVGLYDPLDGMRLPLFAPDGTPLGDALPVQLAP